MFPLGKARCCEIGGGKMCNDCEWFVVLTLNCFYLIISLYT